MIFFKRFFNQPDLACLFLRALVGATMVYVHGLGKIPPSSQLIDGVASIGFPQPLMFAWAAALSEFLGGILLVFGLYTRWAALFLGFTMSVALFRVHAADPFQVKELAMMYFSFCFFLLFNGAGKYSLDSLIRKK